MGLLEVKHGLLQIAESLDFLHNHAHLIHGAISPEVTYFSFLFVLYDNTIKYFDLGIFAFIF